MNNLIILSSASVIVVTIIVVLAMSVSDETVSVSEQELKESIQKEISKSPQITGIHAQTICKIIELDCSDQTSFYATLDPSDGYTKFRYFQDGVHYDFRILDDKLEYHTNQNPDQWVTYEEKDQWMWDYDAESDDPVTESAPLTEQNYSRTFHYDSDDLGNYERWCSTYNGIYYPSVDGSKVRCEYTTEKDHDEAREGLRELQKKKISGELAQKLCRAYGKECEPGIFITMEYDLETGELYKLKRNEDISSGHFYTEYRIIDDDVIQYRYPTGHASSGFPWKTFEE
ncbi:hypothetical protein [Nitrosopumilus sp.]|uniref:hypothetical protein n=1 Tax=Nitrosopumilus sp. TaxID=2024843 RepID=UPI00247BCE6D|nr:hypothetical protein [Nitrosopumilus sp.]MCV0410514.1 hypothetical protein [Nitrosopumilus sp.]